MADSSGRSLEDIMSSENVPELLKDAIIAQEARYVNLKSSNAARNEIYEAYYKLESLKTSLRSAIVDQGRRVRKRRSKSEIGEALKRQKLLKADYKAATGCVWSDVREEGPVLLTTNKIRGNEALPELQAMTKDLVKEKIVRFIN